jgi:undecaprenyl-diphosphatase
MLDKLIAADTSLFLWLNGFHSPLWDRIMVVISGKTEWIPLYVIILTYMIYRFRWHSIPIILSLILAITLADQLAVKAFKEVFQRLRPSNDPGLEGLVHIVNGYRGGLYGFVSNHAANSFALATVVSLAMRSRYITSFIFFWAFLVSYSRIYLGVHYPADILGGALLGGLIGWLMHLLRMKLTPMVENLYQKYRIARN